MGIFANETEMSGTRIMPAVDVPGDSGFSAMGKPVSFRRRAAAEEHLKAMGLTDSEERFSLVNRVADKIERDQMNAAMEAAFTKLDVTGCYRLVAVLLTA